MNNAQYYCILSKRHHYNERKVGKIQKSVIFKKHAILSLKGVEIPKERGIQKFRLCE